MTQTLDVLNINMLLKLASFGHKAQTLRANRFLKFGKGSMITMGYITYPVRMHGDTF